MLGKFVRGSILCVTIAGGVWSLIGWIIITIIEYCKNIFGYDGEVWLGMIIPGTVIFLLGVIVIVVHDIFIKKTDKILII